MRLRAAATVLCALAVLTPAAAQDGPPAAKAAQVPPAVRPAAKPAAKPVLSDPEPDQPSPPPSARRGLSQGRLTPPDEMPPASSAKPAAPAESAPASAGALIPPQAAAPAGPPVPETLRESDFDHAACRLELTRMGASYREIAPLTDPEQRDCGIARPIEVAEILPGVTLQGGAAMRCDTARELAHWMHEVVLPAAAHLPQSPAVVSLELGTTYQCRGVVGNGTPQKLSEHATGNAIDIAAFGLDDGTRIEIAPRGDRGDMTVAFQNAVQGAACLFFATVLGPGSNAAHDNHLHLDIKARRGGFRLCQ